MLDEKKIEMIIGRCKDEGNEVKTIYCSISFLLKLRQYSGSFEEADMRDMLKRGIFGRIFLIDIVATSFIKDRVVFSSKRRIKENNECYLITDRDECLKKMKEINSRFKISIDKYKILEVIEEDFYK